MKPLMINNKQTLYLISQDGDILNTKTNKILSGTIRNGYKMVKLTIDGIKKDYLVHRLVAENFLDNPLNLPQVNHKDKNKLNNNVSNLEWISIKDNMLHRSKDLQLRKRKLVLQQVILDEHWRQFLNSPYWVSDDGRCYNAKTKHVLTPISNGEYLKYCFSINGEKSSMLIHKLVYRLFMEDYDPAKLINHIDGNKKNNSLSNLELISSSENMQHSYYTLHKNITKIGLYDLSNNLICIFNSMSEAARLSGCSISGISQVCAGKAKTHKNFIWKKIV